MPKTNVIRKSPLDEAREQLAAADKRYQNNAARIANAARDADVKVVAAHTEKAGDIGHECEVARAQAATECTKAIRAAAVVYDMALRIAKGVRDKALAAAQKLYEAERDSLSAKNAELCLPIETSMKAARAEIAAKWRAERAAADKEYEAACWREVLA